MIRPIRMKDWTIRTKLLAIFSSISALLVFQMLAAHVMSDNTTIKAKRGLDQGYTGSLIAADMRFNVSQIWQYLTDVSATHEPDGFVDADKAYVAFHKDAAALTALHPDFTAEIQDTVSSCEKMYDVGKVMAHTYMDKGVIAGNEKMKGFDKIGEELAQRVEHLQNNITGKGRLLLEQSITQSRAADQISLGLASSVIVLILSVSALVSTLFTKRLKRLVETANLVASGDVHQEVIVDNNDELGIVSEAFREMVAYQLSMATVAKQVSEGNLLNEVSPKSAQDAFGQALVTMTTQLRLFVGSISVNGQKLGDASAALAKSSANASSAATHVVTACQDVREAASQSSNTSDEIARTSEH